MEGLKPGRIVYYVLDESDIASIHALRSLQFPSVQWNEVYRGEPYPAMVTRVWSDEGSCNLKVMLDGIDTYWATSVRCDPEKVEGTWHWMFEGQNTRYDATKVK